MSTFNILDAGPGRWHMNLDPLELLCYAMSQSQCCIVPGKTQKFKFKIICEQYSFIIKVFLRGPVYSVTQYSVRLSKNLLWIPFPLRVSFLKSVPTSLPPLCPLWKQTNSLSLLHFFSCIVIYPLLTFLCCFGYMILKRFFFKSSVFQFILVELMPISTL